MFSHNSRYYHVANAKCELVGGRTIVYKQRRFLPRTSTDTCFGLVRVRPGDRPDLIAGRALGDPLLHWRLADANNVLSPNQLSTTAGAELDVPSAFVGAQS